MQATPRILERQCEWRSSQVADPSDWIELLGDAELDELDAALRHALEKSDDVLAIGRDDFPLPTLAGRLRRIERELIDGRGFALIRGLPRGRYEQAELEMLYWGIGMHLGDPWPQNARGHVLGDVTDQGKAPDDPTARGNEIGGAPLEYHSDGADLVGLLCLQKAASGGISAVANAVAIHNDLVREAPELVAPLYAPQPNDFRGEQEPGGRPWYEIPVFTDFDERLFVRYIRPYILASQRHPEAPRLGREVKAGLQRIFEMAQDPDYNVFMDLEPGDIQFVNNYHVLHARTAYEDDRTSGRVRHLKRLWLATRGLEERPPHFQQNTSSHWERNRSASRMVVGNA